VLKTAIKISPYHMLAPRFLLTCESDIFPSLFSFPNVS